MNKLNKRKQGGLDEKYNEIIRIELKEYTHHEMASELGVSTVVTGCKQMKKRNSKNLSRSTT